MSNNEMTYNINQFIRPAYVAGLLYLRIRSYVTKRIFQDSQQQESYELRRMCMELKEHLHCTSPIKRVMKEQSSRKYINGYSDINPFTKERIRHQDSVMDNYIED